MTILTTFIYNDELYIRVIPSKALFRSTMIHDVVTRGDIFGLRISDQVLTIIQGASEVTHTKTAAATQTPLDL